MVDKFMYNTILAQTISPCGNYLVAGNTYGDVVVYDLQNILNPDEGFNSSCRRAKCSFVPKEDVQVCSMITTKKFLVIGTVGEISGWNWKAVIFTKTPKSSWAIQIHTPKDALEKPDVNAILFTEADGYLYAGCGDNKIYILNLENGSLVRTMEGHSDYVHSIHNLGNSLISASEDGSVRLWDIRQKETTNIIQPHLNDKVARPELGKWMGAAEITDDWLLCGGGPKLSLWQLRSLDVATVFSLEDSGIHVASFLDDRILAGGASPFCFHVSYAGKVYAQIRSSSTAIYSVVSQEAPLKVMCIAGSSSKIDICTNFNYRDQVLDFDTIH